MFQSQATPVNPSYSHYGMREDYTDYQFHHQQQQAPSSTQQYFGGGGGFSATRTGGGGGGGYGGATSAVGVPGSTLAQYPAAASPAAAAFVSPPIQQQAVNHHHRQQHHFLPAFRFSSTTTQTSSSSIQNHHTTNHNPLRRRISSTTQQRVIKMEAAGGDSDLAAQEAAAREYQPDLSGPLVGQKTTSHAITDEYAKADQVYVAKTIALPQTYSHYRPIQGDGSCGWRAIGFAYFETLIHTATAAGITAELERLTALNDFISNVGGYDRFIWESMVEETLSLLSDLAARVSSSEPTPSTLLFLEQRFNDEEVSSAVIFHLRLLAASWLIGNSGEYAPFIPGEEEGLKNYCEGTLLPTNREIDHLGITLLVSVLLKPVGFVLEIAYLDRSPGSEVNMYRFPESATGQEESALGPMIHLLFRPDHYDILYKPAPAPVNVAVHRVDIGADPFSGGHGGVDISAFPYLDTTVLSMLPGYGGGGISNLDIQCPRQTTYSPSPTASWGGYAAEQQPSFPATTPSSVVPTSTPSPTSNPLRFSKYSFPPKGVASPDVTTTTTTPTTTTTATTSPNAVEDQQQLFAEQQTMTTTLFKNSHFNVAHFNNPNFQPEEYRPTSEEEDFTVAAVVDKGVASGARRKRSAKGREVD